MKIALANYNDERQYVKELPQTYDIPDLYGLAENRLGVATFEIVHIEKILDNNAGGV